MFLQAPVETSTAPALTWRFGSNAPRPWQQKWRDITHDLASLQLAYQQSALDNEAVRRLVEIFFKDCCELADWLKQQAGKSDALGYIKTDPDLKLCNAMAQTTKHHTRNRKSDPNPITARLAAVYGGQAVRGEIAWSAPSGSSGTEDALDLAQRCVGAWQRYFQKHGLTP